MRAEMRALRLVMCNTQMTLRHAVPAFGAHGAPALSTFNLFVRDRRVADQPSANAGPSGGRPFHRGCLIESNKETCSRANTLPFPPTKPRIASLSASASYAHCADRRDAKVQMVVTECGQ
jgi:hypothetical protein